MKKIFIIGSNSFAGSNFIDFLLNKNCKVFGSSRTKENDKQFLKYKKNLKLKNFQFFKIDINKDQKKLFKLINKIKPNYIINFAAQGMVDQSWDTPLDWYQTNIISQVKIVNFLQNKKYIKKYINFSTPEVYGNYKENIDDKTNFDPSTPYALSRMAFDVHLKLMNRINGFPFITTRASNIYGPHQQLYRLIPKLIISGFTNKTFKVDGSGNTIRSFILMDDVSNALYKILFKGKIGETYNISTNKFYTIKKIIKLVKRKMNKKSMKILNIADRRYKDKIYKLNSNKVRKKLNWKEENSLSEGIDKTIDWIKKNYNYVKKHKTKYIHKK